MRPLLHHAAVSLNAKGDKPEPPIEVLFKELEAKVRKTRGANRKRAFAALLDADEAKAIAVVEALADAAAGKVRTELGTLLASTGVRRLVEQAVRGRWGDVPVAAVTPPKLVDEQIGSFSRVLGRLPPATIEQQVRALGLVPLHQNVSRGAGTEVAGILTKLVDDERLARALRVRAAEALAEVQPAAIWGRRERLPIELAVSAGLRANVAVPSLEEATRFCVAVRALAPRERQRVRESALLPASALSLPADVRVLLLALVLDDSLAPAAVKDDAARALADMRTHEADDAVLARPDVSAAATVRVCERIAIEEAHAILRPLIAAREAARDALVRSPLAASPAFIDDAIALLVTDALAAGALLRRNGDARAHGELLAAVEAADAADASLLFAGAALPEITADVRRHHATLSPQSRVHTAASVVRPPVLHLFIEMLERMRTKAGLEKDGIDAALARLHVRWRPS